MLHDSIATSSIDWFSYLLKESVKSRYGLCIQFGTFVTMNWRLQDTLALRLIKENEWLGKNNHYLIYLVTDFIHKQVDDNPSWTRLDSRGKGLGEIEALSFLHNEWDWLWRVYLPRWAQVAFKTFNFDGRKIIQFSYFFPRLTRGF